MIGKWQFVPTDHTLREYDLQGNMLDAFLVSSVENMVYGQANYAISKQAIAMTKAI